MGWHESYPHAAGDIRSLAYASSDLNTGPSLICADSSQACSDLTGHDFSDEPYGMPMRRERPSWVCLTPTEAPFGCPLLACCGGVHLPSAYGGNPNDGDATLPGS